MMNRPPNYPPFLTYPPYDIPDLPPEGLRVAASRPTQRKSSPFIVGRTLYDYPLAVAQLPARTIILWCWPGQWRSDVFKTTAGAIARAMKEGPK